MTPCEKAIVVFVLFTMVPLFAIASWYTCQDGNWILTYICSVMSVLASVLGFYVMNHK
jgi:hypothetical protein